MGKFLREILEEPQSEPIAVPLKTRLSLVAGLIANAWTLYFVVYFAFSLMGVGADVSVPLGILAGMAALVEPVLTYFATGRL